jgi:tyrosyl-tRNA synthetase
MLEREDFRTRLEQHQPISVHELLYPLLTAYDAVALKSDVEIGATEQKFNILVHRDIQRAYGLAGEVAVTMPILVGLDGQRKMSKSLGNYIGITEPPAEIFGKLMSIPDDLMWVYYDLVTDRTPNEITALKSEVASGAKHPMDVKMRLAQEVITGFHGEDAARKAAENFQRVFRDRQAPASMSEIVIKSNSPVLAVRFLADGSVVRTMDITGLSTGQEKWSRLLASLNLVASTSDAERLMKQGGFEIDGKAILDPTSKLDLTKPSSREIRVGKKSFFRVIVE